MRGPHRPRPLCEHDVTAGRAAALRVALGRTHRERVSRTGALTRGAPALRGIVLIPALRVQVYRGVTHDGVDVAVKVPDAVTASSARVAAAARGSSGAAKVAPTPPLPTSTKSEASRRRRQVRSGTVTRLLLATHARRALANKWRSAAAIVGLVWLFARVGVAAVLKSALRALRPGGRSLLAPVALAGAVVAVFEKVLGDRSTIWRSSVAADDAAAALQVSRAEAAGLPVRIAGW